MTDRSIYDQRYNAKLRGSALSSWRGMKKRCLNPKADRYACYGGRGIQICPTWMKFENFLKDMGERPPGTTLDRIESDVHYAPGNCRWAAKDQQYATRDTKWRCSDRT
jgi:hypothetical protein